MDSNTGGPQALDCQIELRILEQLQATERRCKLCCEARPLSDFHSSVVSGKRYWRHTCRKCEAPSARARKRRWYAEDPERARADSRSWYASNKVKAAESALLYKQRKADWWREYHRQWRASNPHKLAAWQAERNSAKVRATPAWANSKLIISIYSKARALTLETGVPHEVDHIVPLRHPLVCGLHVEHNLRAIPAAENNRKNNRWWPDMPERAPDLTAAGGQ